MTEKVCAYVKNIPAGTLRSKKPNHSNPGCDYCNVTACMMIRVERMFRSTRWNTDPRSSSNVLISQHSMPFLSNKRPRNGKVFQKHRINLYREILTKTNAPTILPTETPINCADGVPHSNPQSGHPLRDDGTTDGFSIVKHKTYLNRNLAASEYLFKMSR